jgi:D-aminoacyl-tRNA deacylase
MKLILASAKDPAAGNIAARLLELYDFKECPHLRNAYALENVLLVTINDEATQIIAPPIEAEEVIIASRHASEAGKPSLTVHAPGEVRKRELAIASPAAIKSALSTLVKMREELGLVYDVSLEATHHGPTKLSVPVTFVEIGSTPLEWCNEKAGEAVARAIMAATKPVKCSHAIGFGGPHYAPRHTKFILETNVGIGHIFSRYASIDEELIHHAIERTSGGVELLALDWKGLNSMQRRTLQYLAEKMNLQLVRE